MNLKSSKSNNSLGNTFSVGTTQSTLSTSTSSHSGYKSSSSSSFQRMSTDSACSFTFTYDEKEMVRMLLSCVFNPNDNSLERQSKSLINVVKNGEGNTSLIDFDTNMRKLVSPFVLIFFNYDQEKMMDELRVHTTETYKICDKESFEVWRTFKGQSSPFESEEMVVDKKESSNSQFRFFKSFRNKKNQIIKHWMNFLIYPSHLYTLRTLANFYHLDPNGDELTPPFNAAIYDVKKSFFNFIERDSVSDSPKRPLFVDFIIRADILVQKIGMYITITMVANRADYPHMKTSYVIPDLGHENLYSIVKECERFVLNVPVNLSTEANLFYADVYADYVSILTDHDVYIWLAAFREANFNFMLQLFYRVTDNGHKSHGPYVPLKNFISQVDTEYLKSFYTMVNAVVVLKKTAFNNLVEQKKMATTYFGPNPDRAEYYAKYDFEETFINGLFGSPKVLWKKFQNIVICSEFFSDYIHFPSHENILRKEFVISPIKSSTKRRRMMDLNDADDDGDDDSMGKNVETNSNNLENYIKELAEPSSNKDNALGNYTITSQNDNYNLYFDNNDTFSQDKNMNSNISTETPIFSQDKNMNSNISPETPIATPKKQASFQVQSPIELLNEADKTNKQMSSVLKNLDESQRLEVFQAAKYNKLFQDDINNDSQNDITLQSSNITSILKKTNQPLDDANIEKEPSPADTEKYKSVDLSKILKHPKPPLDHNIVSSETSVTSKKKRTYNKIKAQSSGVVTRNAKT